jgi:hypothetical protein
MVVEPEAIITTAITVDNSNCTVCSDGSINLTVTGGSLPYTFVWSNRLQLKYFKLNKGSYSVVTAKTVVK